MNESDREPLVRFVLGIGANARLGSGSRDAAGALLEGRPGFQVIQAKGASEGDLQPLPSAPTMAAGRKEDAGAEIAAFQNMLSRIGRKD